MDSFLATQISKAQAFIGHNGFSEPLDFDVSELSGKLQLSLFETNRPDAAQNAVEQYNALFGTKYSFSELCELDCESDILKAVCFIGVFFTNITPTYHIELVNQRALITARIAYDLASLPTNHYLLPHEAYLVTYMSFAGSMVLASKYEEDYTLFFERYNLTPYSTSKEESITFGMSSHFISAAICATWGIDSNLIKGVLGSQYQDLNFLTDPQVRTVAGTILLASCLNRYMQGFEGDEFMEMLEHSQKVTQVSDKDLDRILAKTRLNASRMII